MLRRPLLPEDEDCEILPITRPSTLTTHELIDAGSLALTSQRPVRAAAVGRATALSEDIMETDRPAEPEVSKTPLKRARARGAVVSRFKGFDEDDDFSAPVSSRPAPVESQMDSIPNSGRSHRYSVSCIQKSTRSKTD